MEKNGKKGKKLFLATFEIRNGESEYTIKHTITSAKNDKDAEMIALFFARDFWGAAENAEPTNKETKKPYGWFSPNGEVAITFKGLGEVTPEQAVKEFAVDVELKRMRRLWRR